MHVRDRELSLFQQEAVNNLFRGPSLMNRLNVFIAENILTCRYKFEVAPSPGVSLVPYTKV
jgi:hypothetical protein